MKPRVTHLLTALFAALFAALLLAACSAKPLEERDLVSKLRRSDAFLPGGPEIDSFEILSRSTDKKKGTDTLTVTVHVEDPIEAELTYRLTYTAGDDSWRLTSADQAEDGLWTLEGPTRRELESAAQKRDDFLQEHQDADVTVKTTSEADDFDPEDGTYAKALTLSLTAPYGEAVYNATVKASYTLTEDGWELDRWRTTDSGFSAGEAPESALFTDAVITYADDHGLYYDSLLIVDQGEDLEAGTAWARISAYSHSYSELCNVDFYQVNAVLDGFAWTVPADGAEIIGSSLSWDDSAFPILYEDAWEDGFSGSLVIESADGRTMRIRADMAYFDGYNTYRCNTHGTVEATLGDLEGDGYSFSVDGVGDFFLDNYNDLCLLWFYKGSDYIWDTVYIEPTFAAAGPGPSPIEPEPLPTSLDHWDFESADGLTTVHQIPRPAVSELTGVDTDNFEIVESRHEPIFADGPVGQALYLDGKYGVSLDMKAPADDSYTIAFWYNGDRFITLGPILQMGRNIGMAENPDPASAVAWINVCQANWGADGGNIAPVFWNRNSSIPQAYADYGVWPWIAADTVYGKREWVHVALVVDGNRYTCPDDNGDRIGAKLYVNGELMFDANADNLFYQGVAPEIFRHLDTAVRGLEAYIGINYWDACYKGFIDDLYVYDEALTAYQVKALYAMGDPTAASYAPEYTGPTDGEDEAFSPDPQPIDPATLGPAPVYGGALDAIGSPDRSMGFWEDTSDSYELKNGGSVTFRLNNYSNGVANWDNFILGFSGIPVTTDKVASSDSFPGYREWFVFRADAYGWAPQGMAYNMSYDLSSNWDWTRWLNLMTDAEATVSVTRNGGEITVDCSFTGADGTVMSEHAVVDSSLTASDPCHVFLTAEGAYVELLGVDVR